MQSLLKISRCQDIVPNFRVIFSIAAHDIVVRFGRFRRMFTLDCPLDLSSLGLELDPNIVNYFEIIEKVAVVFIITQLSVEAK